jgi:hypothetical protein
VADYGGRQGQGQNRGPLPNINKNTAMSMNAATIKDAINLAGSVASLTCISLLWLKAVVPSAKLAIAITASLPEFGMLPCSTENSTAFVSTS